MGDLRGLSGRDIIRILEKHGFLEVRQKSSHIVMQKKSEEKTITVIVPDHKEIRIAGVRGQAMHYAFSG